MKRLTLILGVLVALAGCVPGMYPPQTGNVSEETIPAAGEEYAASIGDTFFKYYITGNYGGSPNNWQFDLTVVELSNKKLGLQYSEYTYQVNPYSYVGSWLIKDGFNKRFDFSLEDKTLYFKDYVFEVISVEKGKIRYKRIQ